MKALQTKYGGYSELNNGRVSVTNPPKRVRTLAAAIKNVDSENVSEITFAFRSSNNWYEGGYRWVLNCGGNEIFSLKATEGEETPVEYEACKVDKERYDALYAKLGELRQKNYKVLLVESILSGSVAGTTVLADLNKMVEQMVAAPVTNS